jgi:hypothetical protein
VGQVEPCPGHLAGDGITPPQNVFADLERRMRCFEAAPFAAKNLVRCDAEALAAFRKVSRILKAGQRIFFSDPAEFASAESIFFALIGHR